MKSDSLLSKTKGLPKTSSRDSSLGGPSEIESWDQQKSGGKFIQGASESVPIISYKGPMTKFEHPIFCDET